MSYDVTLENYTPGPDWHNYTSNCALMWRAAGVDLAEFEGRPARECEYSLAVAIGRMEADPDTYRAMNPANGWGDYDGCLAFLRGILRDLRNHPHATVRVSY